MHFSKHVISLFLAMCTALTALMAVMPAARADNFQPSISGQAFEQANGVISLNQAAGEGSQQTNARSIALSPNGNAQATAVTVQVAPPVASATADVSTSISNGAFRGAAGLIGINQSAGAGNVQANGAAIGLGQMTEVNAASVLARTAPNAAGLDGSNRPRPAQHTLSVDETFVGAAGIVQVNQAGGAGNASANNFVLGITAPKP